MSTCSRWCFHVRFSLSNHCQPLGDIRGAVQCIQYCIGDWRGLLSRVRLRPDQWLRSLSKNYQTRESLPTDTMWHNQGEFSAMEKCRTSFREMAFFGWEKRPLIAFLFSFSWWWSQPLLCLCFSCCSFFTSSWNQFSITVLFPTFE